MTENQDDSTEETALTRTSQSSLRRLDTNLEATERALALEEDRYVRFFQEHDELFKSLLSRWHPLDSNLLERYEDFWDWDRLSKNEALPWTPKLIDSFIDRWEWKGDGNDGLSSNESLPWSVELIERYRNGGITSNYRWDWE